eukprot:gene1035-619_t
MKLKLRLNHLSQSFPTELQLAARGVPSSYELQLAADGDELRELDNNATNDTVYIVPQDKTVPEREESDGNPHHTITFRHHPNAFLSITLLRFLIQHESGREMIYPFRLLIRTTSTSTPVLASNTPIIHMLSVIVSFFFLTLCCASNSPFLSTSIIVMLALYMERSKFFLRCGNTILHEYLFDYLCRTSHYYP